MLQILRHPVFVRLFAAQVLALVATGLLTIALGLLAFGLAGDRAGQVLGIALTIKMLAYVGVAPVMTAVLARVNRRAVLIGADVVRAVAALSLPFIDAVWQIYLLIFLLQAASATFTPTFQAIIPDVLKDERAYTRALSLARLTFDIEALLSPVIAGLLLLVLEPSTLFGLTALGFIGSAILVFTTEIPPNTRDADLPFPERVTRGSRIYFATPRLRGLFALGVTVAFVAAIVIVQSVVVAKGIYAGSESDLALLLGAYGLGSMIVALSLPKVLDHVTDRDVMIPAGYILAGTAVAFALVVLLSGWPNWSITLGVWLVLGGANTAILTPAGRLLRRSAHPVDRPAIFAAQFALSHAAFLLAYPAAGFVGAGIGIDWALLLLGMVALSAAIAARVLWPQETTTEIEHSHEDLPPDHPHLRGAVQKGGQWVHRHAFVIDDEHRAWPTSG